MRYRSYDALPRELPVIGQGTWHMEHEPRSQVIDALHAGLDLGMTHIDTAEMYGSGRVEEIVGEAIAGRREETFLASKVLPSNASYQGTLRACEASLQRLKTDHLDLYMLHWPGTHPLEETFKAFERLQTDGKILAWGVSNFDADELEDAVSIAGEGKLACNQVLYHLQERAIEHDVLPWCASHRVPVVAYSPFGSGRFPRTTSAGGRVLAEIAERYEATPRQIALAFLIGHPQVLAIPKAGQVEHVRDNAAAADLSLSDEDIAQIDQAFPRGRRPHSLPFI